MQNENKTKQSTAVEMVPWEGPKAVFDEMVAARRLLREMVGGEDLIDRASTVLVAHGLIGSSGA